MSRLIDASYPASRPTPYSQGVSETAVRPQIRYPSDKRLTRAPSAILASCHTPRSTETGPQSIDARQVGNTLRQATQLDELTGLESRVSILGYVQRAARHQ